MKTGTILKPKGEMWACGPVSMVSVKLNMSNPPTTGLNPKAGLGILVHIDFLKNINIVF